MADSSAHPLSPASSLNACVESLWEALAPQWPGLTVEFVARVPSTNSALMQRAREGDTAPVLMVAEVQTAGRGRLGKAWHSRVGDSLTFSLARPLRPADWSGLSLAVGVALAEALHPAVRLKWPNDLWLEGRKLGGILIETAGSASAPGRQVVVGVGLNLRRPPDAVVAPRDDGLAEVWPAGLESVWPEVTPAAALTRVAGPLMQALQTFEDHGLAPFMARFAARDALAGRSVRLSDGTEGQAEGLDADGALRVRTVEGLRRVHSAEVSVRPC